MKSIFSATFLIFITFNVFAQTSDSTKSTKLQPDPPQAIRYLLPGGKIVSADKLDSVIKSWNHQRFTMKHDDNKPGIIELILMTDAMQKQFDDDKQTANVMLNQPAPEFELTDIYGQHHRLSELKGKVVVLNFWFTSCAPCREEMPKLNDIKSKADPEKVIFLALALDNAAAVREFLHGQEFTYELLPNAKEVHAAYKVASCPTSMVIDKKGIIRFIQSTSGNIEVTLPAAIKAQL
jgi:peroxiredoxin